MEKKMGKNEVKNITIPTVVRSVQAVHPFHRMDRLIKKHYHAILNDLNSTRLFFFASPSTWCNHCFRPFSRSALLELLFVSHCPDLPLYLSYQCLLLLHYHKNTRDAPNPRNNITTRGCCNKTTNTNAHTQKNAKTKFIRWYVFFLFVRCSTAETSEREKKQTEAIITSFKYFFSILKWKIEEKSGVAHASIVKRFIVWSPHCGRLVSFSAILLLRLCASLLENEK